MVAYKRRSLRVAPGDCKFEVVISESSPPVKIQIP